MSQITRSITSSTKERGRIALASAIAVMLMASAAGAQIDSPPPDLQGEPSYHLYTVPFVQGSSGQTRLFVACSNAATAAVRIGVEGFNWTGGLAVNDPSVNSISVAAGGSTLLGPNSFGFSAAAYHGIGAGISNGTARILATTRKGIVCSAFVADITNDPPASMMPLTLVSKTKQKGD